MISNVVSELLKFVNISPTSFHVVDNIKKKLVEEGYIQLEEQEKWEILSDKGYFVTRNNSSIIAFKTPKNSFEGFNITAVHGDSPNFKLKDSSEIKVDDSYVKLNTEKYGGMNLSSWFDRPLSIAGRVVLKTEKGIKETLVNIDRDLLLIPSLAIHMNRELNNGYKYNEQKDMLPLFSGSIADSNVKEEVAKSIGVSKDDIISTELFLYNREKGILWGQNKEFISAPRLDNIISVYAGLRALIEAEDVKNMPVLAVFDNEEVGSSTKQGAGSTFLRDVLQRIVLSMEQSQEDYYRKLASSFMISADGAHGMHPNYMEKADPTNKAILNRGVVIKCNASGKYTSDGLSTAVFKEICNRTGIQYQMYYNPSDIPGGSTLGNISGEKVSINSVDIGVAQLGMHSAFETAGAKDIEKIVKALICFFETSIKKTGNNEYWL